MQHVGYTYTKIYLKFKFNWASWIVMCQFYQLRPRVGGGLLSINDFSFLRNWGFLWGKGDEDKERDRLALRNWILNQKRGCRGGSSEAPQAGTCGGLGTAGSQGRSGLCGFPPFPDHSLTEPLSLILYPLVPLLFQETMACLSVSDEQL